MWSRPASVLLWTLMATSAGHDPTASSDDQALHGAACHGCLLVAETSCEARNLHLDRALLVETMATKRAAFFHVDPA